eukprot:jgi/Chrzof1/12289/Cz06g29010.t1
MPMPVSHSLHGCVNRSSRAQHGHWEKRIELMWQAQLLDCRTKETISPPHHCVLPPENDGEKSIVLVLVLGTELPKRWLLLWLGAAVAAAKTNCTLWRCAWLR